MTTDAYDVVEIETRIRARPETVFAFLTDPERYVRWQGSHAELDPTPGGIFSVAMPDGAVVRGSYVVVEPPHRLVFTWGWEGDALVPPGHSIVEITLTFESDETVLRLRHSGLPSAASRELHAGGWRIMTARLATVAADVEAGRDPSP